MVAQTLYESASSDGYRSSGDGIFFTSEPSARAAAVARHQGHAADPLRHAAVTIDGQNYWLLSRKEPVQLGDTHAVTAALRKQAAAKLTPEELRALGVVVS